jgi:hypothetical protein
MCELLSRRLVVILVAGTLVSALTPTIAIADAPLPAAREGCISQWMFNGIWRVRVTKVEPLAADNGNQIGWLVTEQWRNGTNRTWSPGDTFAQDQTLVLGTGAVITPEETTVGTLSAQDVVFHAFPPAAQYTHQQKFISAGALDPSNKPASVVIPFDASKQAANKQLPQYTISPANYRIKFGCTATPEQQAQGGSFELPAKKGCLNQWLSNGFWKVRATKVDPEMDGANQIGWQVAQDWVNISGRKLAPGQTFLMDQQLVLSNDDTVSSGNVTVTTLKAQQLTSHDFAPGESFAFVQNFRYFRPAFDPTNKPTRLIVVWDVGAYKYFNGKPFPSDPPNFRIRFDCSK